MGLQAILDYAIKRPGGPMCVALLLLVGAIQGLKAVVRLTSGVWVYFLRPGKDLKRLGPWAVVTGATDGIGLAYAKALAKQGRDAVGDATSLRQHLISLASFEQFSTLCPWPWTGSGDLFVIKLGLCEQGLAVCHLMRQRRTLPC